MGLPQDRCLQGKIPFKWMMTGVLQIPAPVENVVNIPVFIGVSNTVMQDLFHPQYNVEII